MKNFKTISLLILVLAITVTACKKEEKESNSNLPITPKCLVKSISTSTGILRDYVYDNANNFLSLTIKNGSSEFTYNYTYLNNSVKIGNNETYHLNSFGLAESSDHIVPDGEMHFIYQYDNQNQIISAIGNGVGNGKPSTLKSFYEYSNGNMVKSTTESSTSTFGVRTFEYYLDKLNPFKKTLERKTFKNANTNLVKAEYLDGKLSVTYSYEFDEKGNVTKKTETYSKGEEFFETYTWDCPN
ncbi:MAG: hypothetical protein K9H61_13610 [Bacteroidia bacterium]|nr:hypothetical protein [Bacteroidia bacterium]MCF8426231.1 hypothetical protein [Bacteroidia bacterium]MCF8448021.1 hypothetical protein [Bacteroidia bacterium]